MAKQPVALGLNRVAGDGLAGVVRGGRLRFALSVVVFREERSPEADPSRHRSRRFALG